MHHTIDIRLQQACCYSTDLVVSVCYFNTPLFTVQEQLVTKQVDMASNTVDMEEEEELKLLVYPWGRPLVTIQCTKSPDVVKRAAELLAEVGRGEEGNLLKGQ